MLSKHEKVLFDFGKEKIDFMKTSIELSMKCETGVFDIDMHIQERSSYDLLVKFYLHTSSVNHVNRAVP